MVANAAAWTAVAVDFPRDGGWDTTSGVRFGGDGSSVSLPDARERWGDPATATAAVYRLAAQVRDREPGILRRIFPALAVGLVRGEQAPAPAPSPSGPPVPAGRLSVEEGWLVAVRLVEAVRIVLADAATAGDRSAAGILPLVHRTRFLLLWAPRRFPAVDFPVRRAFGSLEAFLPRAEQARLDWALDLVNHEEHPGLLSWSTERLDAELRRLAFVGPAPAPPPGGTPPAGAGTGWHEPLPAPLPADVMREIATPSGAGDPDPGFRSWLVREAFLPRFMLLPAWRTLRPTVGRRPLVVLALLAMLLVAPAVAVAFDGHPVGVLRGVAAVAGAAYLAMFLLAVGRREMTSLWCLRLPAGAALGAVALISLDDGWAHPDGWAWPMIASAVLLATATGYLVFEAQGHGVPGGRILAGRVLAVVLLGFAHAVGVASLALAAVVPAVKPGLASTIAGASATAPGVTGPGVVGLVTVDPGVAGGPAVPLTLAASVGLAAGVLLQMLWDDRPVTYPLTHLPWRGRAR
ncbi:hypothetical protein BL254_00670 [Protofrankia sp. BMG5.30]|nr:hypothetical protein BL254_00670 [Protofrankia sp. BMG5.30]